MYLPDRKAAREDLLFRQNYPKMLNSSYNCIFLSSANWFGFLEIDVNLSLICLFLYFLYKREIVTLLHKYYSRFWVLFI